MNALVEESKRSVVLRNLRDDSAPEVKKVSLPLRVLHWMRSNKLFAVVCVLPVLLATVYFTVFASDIYVSETRYVVRTPTDVNTNLISGLVQSSGAQRATDDAYVIGAYLLSRDAMDLLRKEAALEAAYGAAKADLLSRYPGMLGKVSSEGLYRYFLSMTSVRYDGTTGIATLSVSAFDPKDARAIALALIKAGERLANRLTARMREDLVARAVQEMDTARERAHLAQQRLTEWRSREEQIDPTRFSFAIIEVIARLSFELALVRAQVAEIQKASPQSPSIPQLQIKIDSLEAQIEREKRGLAGASLSLAPKITEYEQLQLERMMAERIFSSTVAAQEAARADAQRQQIYLERIVEPQLADYPSGPSRLLWIFSILVISGLSYMILSKIIGNLERHAAFAHYFKNAKSLV